MCPSVQGYRNQATRRRTTIALDEVCAIMNDINYYRNMDVMQNMDSVPAYRANKAGLMGGPKPSHKLGIEVPRSTLSYEKFQVRLI